MRGPKKHDTIVLVRMPNDFKEKFKAMCDHEMVDMSVKIRQLMAKEMNKK